LLQTDEAAGSVMPGVFGLIDILPGLQAEEDVNQKTEKWPTPKEMASPCGEAIW